MEENNDIVSELAQNEIRVSELYRKYAQLFSDMKEFWDENAAEEANHYKLLMELEEKKSSGKIFIDEKRFQPEAVKLVRSFIEEKFNEQNPTVIDALINSENIENSLLEKNIFEIFESDAPEIKVTLKILEDETREHLESVREKIKEILPSRTLR